jgi:hypothetical protein
MYMNNRWLNDLGWKVRKKDVQNSTTQQSSSTRESTEYLKINILITAESKNKGEGALMFIQVDCQQHSCKEIQEWISTERFLCI